MTKYKVNIVLVVEVEAEDEDLAYEEALDVVSADVYGHVISGNVEDLSL